MLRLKHFLRFGVHNFIKQKNIRFYAAESAVDTDELSVRQKAWLEAQKKYEQFPHIHYSSYIESLRPQMPYQRAKHINNATNEQQLKDLLEQVQLRRSGHVLPAANNSSVTAAHPKNWMQDYEFYEEAIDEEGNIDSKYGTADITMLPSTVPCNGCGAHLHCASSSLPGFIPKEIFYGRSDAELRTITCQRCHFLKNYNIALDVEVPPESYVQTIARIKDKFALVLIIVDLLDLPCTIWPGLADILGDKRPVFVVGNKVDLLPRDSNGYLNHIKSVLKEQVLQSGFNALNIKHIALISAKTGYGIEELITQLHKIWSRKGDVYIIGCTNVGKSTLFNILLNSDYCRPEATNLVRKATTCPWPGTTLQMLKFPIMKPSEIRVYYRVKRLTSERVQRRAEQQLRRDQASQTGSIQAAQLVGHVGRSFDKHAESNDVFACASGTQPITTLNDKSYLYKNCKWCFDTPGVLHPDQFSQLLTTEELLHLAPKQMIQPRALRLLPGMSLFLAGLGRLDYIGSNSSQHRWIRAFVFASLQLPLLIADTAQAEQVYNTYVGTKMLGVPCGSAERLARWPGLQCAVDDFSIVGNAAKDVLTCDVVLSAAGWVGLEIPENEECKFKAWTPEARGIHLRKPALIQNAERLIGKHIRNSLAYNLSRPFVFVK